MRKRNTLVLTLLALALLAVATPAQWSTIAPGFDYREYALSGPVEVFVMRMTRSDPASRAIDSCIGQGQFRGTDLPLTGRETVSGMATRYDDTINYYWQTWGQRSEVIAAINGDFWETSPTVWSRPVSGQIISGWFARRFLGYAGGSGFFWTIWGVPHIGGDVRNGETGAARQRVQFADLSDANLTGVNVERETDDLILYTPHWDAHTHTDSTGVEVLVQMSRPNLPLPPPNWATGTVVAVRDGQGSTPIPFDHVVLSGHGTAATTLRNRCSVGDQVGLQMYIRDYGLPTTPPLPTQDWTKAYGSVGVDREVVIEGQVPTNTWPTTRDPRTAVAFNDSDVFFIVVDGRSAQSIGMSFAEVGVFCRDTLAATHAAMLDGGGSSAMWVQGQGIVNTPSDGSERATTNGLMMVEIQPRVLSTVFSEGELVGAQGAIPLRLGPGTNCASLATIAADATGTVESHALNGVFATGQQWWLCDFGGTEGWAPETSLGSVTGVIHWALYR